MLTIPVYDVAVIPHATIYLSREYYKRMTGVEAKAGAEVVFLFEKNDTPYNELNADSFEAIGVSGEVTESNVNDYVAIKTSDRVNVKAVTVENHMIFAETTERPDLDDLTPDEEKAALKRVKDGLLNALQYFQGGQIYRSWIMRLKSIADVIAMSSSWLAIEPEDKYAFVATDSKKERTSLYEKAIFENLEIYKVTSEAETAQENENQKVYREQAIKKQMEFLQKELDEMHPENVSEVRKFEIKLNDAKMNKEADQEARKALNRMKQEGENSPEYGQLYNYLDFMTSLPWKKSRFKAIDLDSAQKILDEDHYGLKKVKERILQQIAVMNLNKKQSGSILLFVGAPGTGKTSIGQSIAKALDRDYVRVALGGVRDEADIRGHRRTYIGAMPGRIMDAINKAGSSNPVMVLDEVDKLSASYNGDPASALLEVLDPEQNFSFTDHYMNVPYDLSDVFFICTANTVDTIPEPLLNRMEVIQFNGYSPLEKKQIARQHLLPKARNEMGLKEDQLVIDDDMIAAIISDYTMEAGVRGLKKRMDTICRVAAVDIVKGADKVEVKPDNIRHFLDMRPIIHDHILDTKQPGIVTGLAWTQVGGEILFIETALTKGKGNVIITGQLGDVMKESAQIAISIVKEKFPDKADLFENHDLHIHVPEGAVPKDGPSAGITLTTALASLVNDKVVDPTIAMTGEVSLRQKVMPIGGLPEKLMAAQRAGVKTVFIPKDNVLDLEDVADEVKNALDIHPVEDVDEVLKAAHIID
jgi:ATP-dependent Lon protease